MPSFKLGKRVKPFELIHGFTNANEDADTKDQQCDGNQIGDGFFPVEEVIQRLASRDASHVIHHAVDHAQEDHVGVVRGIEPDFRQPDIYGNAHEGPGMNPYHKPVNCQERWMVRDLNESRCMQERPIESNHKDLAYQADLAKDSCYLSQFFRGISDPSQVDGHDGGDDDEIVRPHREEYQLCCEAKLVYRHTEAGDTRNHQESTEDLQVLL